jgi:hypothetical protein
MNNFITKYEKIIEILKQFEIYGFFFKIIRKKYVFG